MTLSILIVTYNSGSLAKACIESILERRLSISIEFIVVDNASSDESATMLQADFPEIKVIKTEQNLGLAAGVNLALAQSTGQYKLLLNPDIIVLPGAIEKMLDFMDQEKDVGMLGGKLLSPNGELQESCFRFYTPLTILYRRTWLGRWGHGRSAIDRFLMKDFSHLETRDVDWLMGSCLLMREQAIEQVGGMDERYFLYFEDVDWCRRFWEAGWRVTYFPQAEFSHYYQQSSRQGGILKLFTNRAVREHIKSSFKYFWKYRAKPVLYRSD